MFYIKSRFEFETGSTFNNIFTEPKIGYFFIKQFFRFSIKYFPIWEYNIKGDKVVSWNTTIISNNAINVTYKVPIKE